MIRVRIGRMGVAVIVVMPMVVMRVRVRMAPRGRRDGGLDIDYR